MSLPCEWESKLIGRQFQEYVQITPQIDLVETFSRHKKRLLAVLGLPAKCDRLRVKCDFEFQFVPLFSNVVIIATALKQTRVAVPDPSALCQELKEPG